MSAAALRPHELATWADLAAIPAEERWHEVLSGDLTERVSPSGEHGGAHRRAGSYLDPFERRPGGRAPGGWWFTAETEVRLDPNNIVRPDLAGWRRERCPDMPRGFPIDLRPDWVCEIVSPGYERRDRHDKVRLYHRFGIPHYWLIDLRTETLEVLRYTPEGWLLALSAKRGETVRPEPFEARPLQVGVLFGDEPDDDPEVTPPG